MLGERNAESCEPWWMVVRCFHRSGGSWSSCFPSIVGGREGGRVESMSERRGTGILAGVGRTYATGESGPTCNPVCTSSGTMKAAPARKEGAGHWNLQNIGRHLTASAGSNATSQRLPCRHLLALQTGRFSPDHYDMTRSQGNAGRYLRQS